MMLGYLFPEQVYDPEKAKWSTFVDSILNHKCASLIDAARAENGIWLEDKDSEDGTLTDHRRRYFGIIA